MGSAIEINTTGTGLEYNASVVMFDDASLFAVWDDGDEINVRKIESDGTRGTVYSTPSRVDILEQDTPRWTRTLMDWWQWRTKRGFPIPRAYTGMFICRFLTRPIPS